MEYRRADQKSITILKEQFKIDNEDYIIEGLSQELLLI